jgi:CheY-like chemotaxis protein
MTYAASRAPGSHSVQFYARERFPLWSVAAFLSEGIRHDRPAMVLTRRPVYDAISGRLGLRAREGAAASPGGLEFLDVDEAFASFMDGPVPDFVRFRRSFGVVTERIRQQYGDGPVWIYGELAGGLYHAGNHEAALQIEDEWNARFTSRDLAVLCGYPTEEGAGVPDMDTLCRQHHHVIPSDDASDARTVYVIDDDPSVRRSLVRLLKSAGLRAQAFASAEAFLALSDPRANGCLILDAQLVGMSGSDLQSHMSRLLGAMPVIAMSGSTDPQIERLSLQLGASAFLRTPFESRALMEIVARVMA